jgi:hypothetical protein
MTKRIVRGRLTGSDSRVTPARTAGVHAPKEGGPRIVVRGKLCTRLDSGCHDWNDDEDRDFDQVNHLEAVSSPRPTPWKYFF